MQKAPRMFSSVSRHVTLLALLTACVSDDEGGAEPELSEVAAEASCSSILAVASVTVSGAQTGNPGTNAVDGNLATRWSQNEIGATLTADLGSLKGLCSASIAWYNGATRTSAFTLEVSKNGTVWEEVADRSSTGTTAGLESYAFTPRDGRYLRLKVFGNSTSNWASVSELRVTGGALTRLTTAQRNALVYGQYKPDATNTGPVPEVTLTQHGTPSTSTDFVVTANNQIVENLEIWGSVNLQKFTNVLIRNCIIHGTLNRGVGTSHVYGSNNDLRGATITDTAFVGRPVTVPASYNGVPNPDAGNVNLANEWVGGIGGANFTVLRTEMRNVSDAIGLNSQLGNVTAKGNWIHDGWMNEWTAAQGTPSGGPARYYPYASSSSYYTHVDGVQFHRGKHYTFVGNRIGGRRVVGKHHATPSQKTQINSGDDMYNAAMMIKQEVDNTPANKLEHITIDRNWFEGGASTINMPYGRDNRFETLYFTNNRFTRSTWGAQWYILLGRDPTGTPIGNFSNNVFEDDGSPVPITRGN